MTPELNEIHRLAGLQWLRVKGDKTLKFDYPLTSDSTVVDIGGYLGDWSAEISKRYDPEILIFEPIWMFNDEMRKRFESNPKIKVQGFGVSNRYVHTEMLIEGASTGVYPVAPKEGTVSVDLKDAAELFSTFIIDLVSMNVEGEEYNILPRLIETGIIDNFENIQIQFHINRSDAAELRDNIREGLRKTHNEQYAYPFIWESWKRK